MNRKKILFVSARLPYPALEGHQIRALGVLKELSKFSDVHLLSILREGEVIDEASPLHNYCSSVEGVPLKTGFLSNIGIGLHALVNNEPLVVRKYTSNTLRRAFEKKITNEIFDIVHLDLLPLAGLLDLIPENISTVLNEHNIESDLIEQKLGSVDSFVEKFIYKREFLKLREFERQACLSVSSVLACSYDDQSTIKKMGADNVHCIPNGVDTSILLPDYSSININRLVFIGGMGWYPNKLGIEWFISEVLPILVKSNPEIQLDLIGNPNPFVTIPDYLKQNVNKLGFVDDFKPCVHQAAIMIVPLHVGSGTRLKVVEGAALGKCIVSTYKGAQGVDLVSGQDVIYADEAEDFANRILELQANKEKILSLGMHARQVAESTYDWKSIGERLKGIYGSLPDKFSVSSENEVTVQNHKRTCV